MKFLKNEAQSASSDNYPNTKKSSKNKTPDGRTLPLKERTNKEMPARLRRNSSGTGKLNLSIFPGRRHLNNRGEGTREQEWGAENKGGEGWEGRRHQMSATLRMP